MAQGFRICDFEFWKAVFEEMLVDRGENWEAGRRGSVVARMSTVIARTKSNRLPKTVELTVCSQVGLTERRLLSIYNVSGQKSCPFFH
jgi:hypothetical protein